MKTFDSLTNTLYDTAPGMAAGPFVYTYRCCEANAAAAGSNTGGGGVLLKALFFIGTPTGPIGRRTIGLALIRAIIGLPWKRKRRV